MTGPTFDFSASSKFAVQQNHNVDNVESGQEVAEGSEWESDLQLNLGEPTDLTESSPRKYNLSSASLRIVFFIILFVVNIISLGESRKLKLKTWMVRVRY